MKEDLRTRLTQSVETAAALAEGLVVIDRAGRPARRPTYSQNFACPEHGVSLPELQPRIFSFNAPHGACPRCTGLGAQQEIDPDLLVPDPTLSIDGGALVPWAVGGSGFYESVIQAIADRYEIPTDVAVARPDDRAAGPLPLRHRRRQGLRAVPQQDGPAPLVHDRLRGDRRVAPAPLPRDRLELAARADRGVHVVPPVPGVQGRAAEARGARGHGRRPEHPRVHEALGECGAPVHGFARADRPPRS